MRKTLIDPARQDETTAGRGWMALDEVASVEVTSEGEGRSVEGALVAGAKHGWLAAGPGPQTIRLIFDQPQAIRAIRLAFKEEQSTRTQEFVLRWLPAGSAEWQDIVRQQWNFSPPNTTQEREQYKVELSAAGALELTITPDISQSGARASLESWQVSSEPESNS